MKAWYNGCVAPASCTSFGDGVANSGDGGGGSNGEELERQRMGRARVGRKRGELGMGFIEEREGEELSLIHISEPTRPY